MHKKLATIVIINCRTTSVHKCKKKKLGFKQCNVILIKKKIIADKNEST